VETWKLEPGWLDVKRAGTIWNQPVPTILQIGARMPAFIFAQNPLVSISLSTKPLKRVSDRI
jgi:hypothetical protein